MPPADSIASDNEATDRLTHREPVSLKRGREGSVDHTASEAASAAYIAAKKNRLEETPETQETQSEIDEEKAPSKEGRTVGEVRRKVQEMTWKEGERVERAASDTDKDEDKIISTPAEGEGEEKRSEEGDWVKVDKAEASGDEAEAEATGTSGTPETTSEDAPSLKRKADEPTEETEEKKRKSTSPTPTHSPPKSAETAAAAEPKKPQATFGSFSAKPSPFAAMAGTSAFGTAAKKTEPNALDKKPAAFASSGFGSYSSAFSPFAAKKSEAKAESSSFGDILKEKGADDAAEEKKPQLDRQDVPTGEEEEETMYQTRAKLFMMEGEGAWKERGVGLLKLNRRRDDRSCARLVMRADGVLRVILNTALYVGMSCLEDGKHVRMTIFEAGERRFVTIRTASPKVATELASAIHEHTPLQSKKSKSPSEPAESAV